MQNDRIFNGLLKAGLDLCTPDQLAARLASDVLVVAPPERAATDLWPAIWCVASILERQFTGKIFIKAGLRTFMPAPIELSERCVLVAPDLAFTGITVEVGTVSGGADHIGGDTRASHISYGECLEGSDEASPIGCFALAGYLGFAALAHAVGIPSFHKHWAIPGLTLPLPLSASPIPEKVTVLGLGQVGQAFLALAFFLTRGRTVRIHLVDKGSFEDPNRRTQLLVAGPTSQWLDVPKADYLATICESWGWNATKEQTTVDWQWRSPLGLDGIGFLGFDDMDSRRMGVEAGFSRVIECGVGTDFLKPHVSWHSLPPDRELAKRFFYEDDQASSLPDTDFIRGLADTPGGCGKVVFEGIQATAPCLGAVAAALATMELCDHSLLSGRDGIAGGAFVWSPLLPFDREVQQSE